MKSLLKSSSFFSSLFSVAFFSWFLKKQNDSSDNLKQSTKANRLKKSANNLNCDLKKSKLKKYALNGKPICSNIVDETITIEDVDINTLTGLEFLKQFSESDPRSRPLFIKAIKELTTTIIDLKTELESVKQLKDQIQRLDENLDSKIMITNHFQIDKRRLILSMIKVTKKYH